MVWSGLPGAVREPTTTRNRHHACTNSDNINENDGDHHGNNVNTDHDDDDDDYDYDDDDDDDSHKKDDKYNAVNKIKTKNTNNIHYGAWDRLP
eukprot:11323564-Alexandrium_andersonii.AAC.1